MLYVSKLVPTHDRGRFVAVGRVFSGTVVSGMKCRIIGSHYAAGKRQQTDIFDQRPIQRVCMAMGRYIEGVEDMPAGNLVGLVGVDKYVIHTATITDAGRDDVLPIRGVPVQQSTCDSNLSRTNESIRFGSICGGAAQAYANVSVN